jgi:hypothetical protein
MKVPPVGEPESQGEIVLYQAKDGETRIEVRFVAESLWLSQKLIAELFQKDVRTINEHLQNVFDEGEVAADSAIRNFRITAADGKAYDVKRYNLDAILAVGYWVRSARGTALRQWASTSTCSRKAGTSPTCTPSSPCARRTLAP